MRQAAAAAAAAAALAGGRKGSCCCWGLGRRGIWLLICTGVGGGAAAVHG